MKKATLPNGLLFNSNSLRDLLVGTTDVRKRKVVLVQSEKMVDSIMRDQVNSVKPKKKRTSKGKIAKKRNLLDRSSNGVNLSKARQLCMTCNNVYEYSLISGLSRDEVEYLDRRFSNFKEKVRTCAENMIFGFKQLSGPEAETITIAEAMLLLNLMGLELENCAFKVDGITFPVVNVTQNGIIEEIPEAVTAGFEMETDSKAEDSIHNSDKVMNFNSFLISLESYVRKKLQVLYLGEMHGWAVKNISERLLPQSDNNDSALNGNSLYSEEYDSSDDIKSGRMFGIESNTDNSYCTAGSFDQFASLDNTKAEDGTSRYVVSEDITNSISLTRSGNIGSSSARGGIVSEAPATSSSAFSKLNSSTTYSSNMFVSGSIGSHASQSVNLFSSSAPAAAAVKRPASQPETGSSSSSTTNTHHHHHHHDLQLLPPLKLVRHIHKQQNRGSRYAADAALLEKTKKQLTKAGGFDASFSRGTPRVLRDFSHGMHHNQQQLLQQQHQAAIGGRGIALDYTASGGASKSDIDALRWELTVAREGVKQLNRMVDTNIAWVQSNCDMTAAAVNFSSRTKLKCKTMATERIVNVYIDLLDSTLQWALQRWQTATRYHRLTQTVVKYSKLKGIEILTNTLYGILCKQLLLGWRPWLQGVQNQIRREQDAATTIIQKRVRGILGRARCQRMHVDRAATVMQCFFRKIKAVEIVKHKRLLHRMDKNTVAAMMIKKFFASLVSIRKAKEEAHRRRQIRASIRIQKIHRGIAGRRKFSEHLASTDGYVYQRTNKNHNINGGASYSVVGGGFDLDGLAKTAASSATTHYQTAVSSPSSIALKKKIQSTITGDKLLPPTAAGIKSPSQPRKSGAKPKASSMNQSSPLISPQQSTNKRLSNHKDQASRAAAAAASDDGTAAVLATSSISSSSSSSLLFAALSPSSSHKSPPSQEMSSSFRGNLNFSSSSRSESNRTDTMLQQQQRQFDDTEDDFNSDDVLSDNGFVGKTSSNDNYENNNNSTINQKLSALSSSSKGKYDRLATQSVSKKQTSSSRRQLNKETVVPSNKSSLNPLTSLSSSAAAAAVVGGSKSGNAHAQMLARGNQIPRTRSNKQPHDNSSVNNSNSNGMQDLRSPSGSSSFKSGKSIGKTDVTIPSSINNNEATVDTLENEQAIDKDKFIDASSEYSGDLRSDDDDETAAVFNDKNIKDGAFQSDTDELPGNVAANVENIDVQDSLEHHHEYLDADVTKVLLSKQSSETVLEEEVVVSPSSFSASSSSSSKIAVNDDQFVAVNTPAFVESGEPVLATTDYNESSPRLNVILNQQQQQQQPVSNSFSPDGMSQSSNTSSSVSPIFTKGANNISPNKDRNSSTASNNSNTSGNNSTSKFAIASLFRNPFAGWSNSSSSGSRNNTPAKTRPAVTTTAVTTTTTTTIAAVSNSNTADNSQQNISELTGGYTLSEGAATTTVGKSCSNDNKNNEEDGGVGYSSSNDHTPNSNSSAYCKSYATSSDVALRDVTGVSMNANSHDEIDNAESNDDALMAKYSESIVDSIANESDIVVVSEESMNTVATVLPKTRLRRSYNNIEEMDAVQEEDDEHSSASNKLAENNIQSRNKEQSALSNYADASVYVTEEESVTSAEETERKESIDNEAAVAAKESEAKREEEEEKVEIDSTITTSIAAATVDKEDEILEKTVHPKELMPSFLAKPAAILTSTTNASQYHSKTPKRVAAAATTTPIASDKPTSVVETTTTTSKTTAKKEKVLGTASSSATVAAVDPQVIKAQRDKAQQKKEAEDKRRSEAAAKARAAREEREAKTRNASAMVGTTTNTHSIGGNSVNSRSAAKLTGIGGSKTKSTETKYRLQKSQRIAPNGTNTKKEEEEMPQKDSSSEEAAVVNEVDEEDNKDDNNTAILPVVADSRDDDDDNMGKENMDNESAEIKSVMSTSGAATPTAAAMRATSPSEERTDSDDKDILATSTSYQRNNNDGNNDAINGFAEEEERGVIESNDDNNNNSSSSSVVLNQSIADIDNSLDSFLDSHKNDDSEKLSSRASSAKQMNGSSRGNSRAGRGVMDDSSQLTSSGAAILGESSRPTSSKPSTARSAAAVAPTTSRTGTAGIANSDFPNSNEIVQDEQEKEEEEEKESVDAFPVDDSITVAPTIKHPHHISPLPPLSSSSSLHHPVPIPPHQAALRIQQQSRLRRSRRVVDQRRNVVREAQKRAGMLIHWAVITIQRNYRGRIGRKQYKRYAFAKQVALAQKKADSARKIQSRARGMRDRQRALLLKEKIDEDKKQLEWMKSFQKGKTNVGGAGGEGSSGSRAKSPLPPSHNNNNNKSFHSDKRPPSSSSGGIDSTKKGSYNSNNSRSTTPKTPTSAGKADNGESADIATSYSSKQVEELEAKIKKLEAIERSIHEKEQSMIQAAQLSEERAAAMERALKQIEEQARQSEADRLARDQLMMMAAGPISHRSEYHTNSSSSNTLGTTVIMTTGPTGRRSMPGTARGQHEAPPTARSARGGASIPPDAPRMTHGGENWVQLWDPDEAAYYWYCERTQFAQWETPGEEPGGDGYYSANNYNESSNDAAAVTVYDAAGMASNSSSFTMVSKYQDPQYQQQQQYHQLQDVPEDDSGYESAGALTDYSTDHYEEDHSAADSDYGDGNGAVWQEYWDEQAQAKYWYNNNTGEASWTRPETHLHHDGTSSSSSEYGANSDMNSIESARLALTSAVAVGIAGGDTGTATGNHANDWVSYIDEETGQAYWYNVRTGETSWA